MPLTKYTEHTIITKKNLLRELSNVRDRGYSYSQGEYVAGSVSIAVPVIVNGKIEAAMGVVNYDERQDIEECYASVLEACKGFSLRLETLSGTDLAG
jgi:DNA-binding IclR family transcriptional regulator